MVGAHLCAGSSDKSLAMMTLDQIARMYGNPAHVRRRNRLSRGRTPADEIHRAMRRKAMAVMYQVGHSPQGIGDYMNCPAWVVEHHLNMYAMDTFGCDKYGMTSAELEAVYDRFSDAGLERLLGAVMGPS